MITSRKDGYSTLQIALDNALSHKDEIISKIKAHLDILDHPRWGRVKSIFVSAQKGEDVEASDNKIYFNVEESQFEVLQGSEPEVNNAVATLWLIPNYYSGVEKNRDEIAEEIWNILITNLNEYIAGSLNDFKQTNAIDLLDNKQITIDELDPQSEKVQAWINMLLLADNGIYKNAFINKAFMSGLIDSYDPEHVPMNLQYSLMKIGKYGDTEIRQKVIDKLNALPVYNGRLTLKTFDDEYSLLSAFSTMEL